MKLFFEVGDRVEALCDYPQENEIIRCGWTGTIVRVDNDCYPPIGVRWDDGCSEYGERHGNARLHNCQESCENGYGWFVNPSDIRICEEVISEDFDVSNDDIFVMIGGLV